MQHSEERKLLSHASIIAVFTILSKLLGLVRDRMLASEFGAGPILDAYYAAFRIPDFIFNLIVLGTVSAAFVPVFLNYVSKKRTEEAYAIANTMLNVVLVSMAIAAGLAFIFAEPLLKVIAPGFTDPETLNLTLSYMRWMLASPIIFGVSSILSGILSAYRRFIAYSLAPVMYNAGIILGILIFVPIGGAAALSWGVVLGAVLHLLVQIPSVMKVGYSWRLKADIHNKGFRRILILMLPRMFGFAALQISLFVTIAIATTLQAGSTTVYTLAMNLQFFAVTIFGTSIATAAFPMLAMAASRQDAKAFRENFSLSFRKIIFFIIPASVLILLFRAQIVRIVLGTGNFDWEDTVLTLRTLAYFSLSLFAQALIPLLTRTFYAIQNTKTPVIIGVLSMAVNIALSLILGPRFGVAGLALAFTVANIINAVLLLFPLRSTVGDLDDTRIIASTFQTTIASMVMGFVAYGLLYATASIFDTHTYLGIILQASISGLGGIISYIVVQYLLKSEELTVYTHLFSKKKNLQ